MAKAVLFGLEIIYIMRARLGDKRYLFDDFYAVHFETRSLFGIVGQDFYLLQAQVADYLGSDSIIPAVGAEAQLQIRIDGIDALLLELVGVEFIRKADAPAFLSEVDDCALSGLFNHFHRGD